MTKVKSLLRLRLVLVLVLVAMLNCRPKLLNR